jgi:hypothetical protein
MNKTKQESLWNLTKHKMLEVRKYIDEQENLVTSQALGLSFLDERIQKKLLLCEKARNASTANEALTILEYRYS